MASEQQPSRSPFKDILYGSVSPMSCMAETSVTEGCGTGCWRRVKGFRASV